MLSEVGDSYFLKRISLVKVRKKIAEIQVQREGEGSHT